MITIQEKLRLVEACFGKYKTNASCENASVICPFCREKGKITEKKKLSISLESGIYHCWVCESKGSNIGWAAKKFSNQSEAASNLWRLYKKSKDEEEPEVIEEKVSLPEDFRLIFQLRHHPIWKHHVAYLLSRGFSYEDMCSFRVGVSSEFEFKDRVIFPSFDEEQNLNYFVARSIEKDAFRRYKNCANERKDMIFREFDLDFSKPLILTEGVFDLLHCPRNSTCILGSWLDENYLLFRKIVQNQTSVILCMDPDALSKSIKIAKKLSEYCIDVKLSQHKDKDFGDMSASEVRKAIENSKPYDNLSRLGYLINEVRSGSVF